jgi:hypothetical protein
MFSFGVLYFDKACVRVQVKYSSDRNWQSCAIFRKVSSALFSHGGSYFDKADVWLQIRYSSDRTWQSCAIFGKMNIALFHTKTLC